MAEAQQSVTERWAIYERLAKGDPQPDAEASGSAPAGPRAQGAPASAGGEGAER